MTNLVLRCKLPLGYPDKPVLTSVSIEGLKRSSRDEIASKLGEKAESLVNQEAVMEMMEEFVRLAEEYLTSTSMEKPEKDDLLPDQTKEGFGRRWVWVHHIKDSARRKAIVAEAQGRQLAGFLKSGYPGIIVVEGRAFQCDQFVA